MSASPVQMNHAPHPSPALVQRPPVGTKPRNRRQFLLSLLLALFSIVLICAFAEVSTRYLLDHSGLTQRRIHAQLPAVLRLRPGTAGQKTILMVGSSQIMQGINVRLFSSELGPSYKVAPLFIEATSYDDWYFGLKRLFRDGARPDVVLLGLSAPTFLETQVRPEYFSQTLLDRRDLPELQQALHLSRAETFSKWLGTYSRFWDSRGPVREKLFSTIFPHYDSIQEQLNQHHRSPVDDAALAAMAPARIARLQEVCSAYGARLIIVLPPSGTGKDYFQAMQESAASSGVTVLLPLQSDTLRPTDFVDGKHLTPAAAIPFTRATARTLQAWFSSQQ